MTLFSGRGHMHRDFSGATPVLSSSRAVKNQSRHGLAVRTILFIYQTPLSPLSTPFPIFAASPRRPKRWAKKFAPICQAWNNRPVSTPAGETGDGGHSDQP